MTHDVISPGPVSVGTSGSSLLTVLLVRLRLVVAYERAGNRSITVMLRYATVEPPLLLAQTV